jgi:hypothetical protein
MTTSGYSPRCGRRSPLQGCLDRFGRGADMFCLQTTSSPDDHHFLAHLAVPFCELPNCVVGVGRDLR